jgi:hypothetical protein
LPIIYVSRDHAAISLTPENICNVAVKFNLDLRYVRGIERSVNATVSVNLANFESIVCDLKIAAGTARVIETPPARQLVVVKGQRFSGGGLRVCRARNQPQPQYRR